jgi:hypothetical protein
MRTLSLVLSSEALSKAAFRRSSRYLSVTFLKFSGDFDSTTHRLVNGILGKPGDVLRLCHGVSKEKKGQKGRRKFIGKAGVSRSQMEPRQLIEMCRGCCGAPGAQHYCNKRAI